MLEVLRKAGVTRARLYGSAARGELAESSEIDLLIENPSDDYKLFRVQDELEKLLGARWTFPTRLVLISGSTFSRIWWSCHYEKSGPY